ncbi:patatin-like phospholipase family protein [Rubrivirga sp. IMCC45206]|uniref:patatin-like phospholipase family protein n=1 Tax=Rubrivirga sp. IMCC45206 TaxID=3391614 RepID=UPI00398F9EF2
MSTRVPLSARPDDTPRRALLLAGGGMRVAYQAGVLIALEEAGLTFAHADGASGGTINLAMLFSGLPPREMAERWRTLDLKDFASPLPLREVLSIQTPGVADADGIRDRVYPHLGIDVDAIRAATGMGGTFNVCDYGRKTVWAVPHAEVTMPLLLAAVSLPGVMPLQEHAGALYTDAVWIKDTNAWEAVRRGAEELWLVWCIGNTDVWREGPLDQYVHMIELSAAGALNEELDRIAELNGRIAAGDSPYGQRTPVRLHVVRPVHPIPLDPDFFLGRITAAELIAQGYADAHRTLRARTPQGVPLTPDATIMDSPRPGVAFRETMSGPFALAESDPEEGAATGTRSGTTLALHASIAIPDIERFEADPDHLGEITGEVEFAPFAERLLVTHGRFNLFAPAASGPGKPLKRMVYEVGFTHAGQPYYLAGHKDVRDDPGFDLWSDTTTLYTRLHEGSDTSGPVVGAGILSLGVADLARLVSTIRATGADGAVARAQAVGAFGRFFLGELWDTYAGSASTD